LPTRREIDRKLRSEGVKVKLVLEFDNIETSNVRSRSRTESPSFREKRFVTKWRRACSRPWNSVIPRCGDLWAPLIRRSARVSPALREFLALLEQTTTSEADSSSEGKSKT
jgi:hypothetical protein